MTIKQHLNENIKINREKRLARLIEIQAPKIIIETEKKLINQGCEKYVNIKKFGDLEFNEAISGIGKGGRLYVRFKCEGQDIICAINKWDSHSLFIATK